MDTPIPVRTIGSVTKWLSGGTPSRNRVDFWSGTIPWISAFTLKDSEIRTSDQFLTQEAVAAGSKLAPVGSTLLLVRGSALHKEIRVGLGVAPVAFNQDVKALIPEREILPKYLTHVIRANESELLKLVTSAGNTAGVLDTKVVQSFEIFLPTQDEQARLVETFDDVDDLIATLERLIAKKQAIKQGMMQQLLTGRTRLPGFSGHWQTTSLGKLGLFLKGRGVKRDDVISTGVPCIRYGELYTAFRDYTATTRSFVRQNVATSALPIRTGDLLFAGSGEARDEIGICVAYIGDAAAVAGGDIVVLRGEDFNPIFLATLTNMPVVANQKARAGQGDAVVHISSRALSEITLTIPCKPEQDAIASVILDADAEIDLLCARLGKARDTKTGMMQQLLTGRVRLPVEASA